MQQYQGTCGSMLSLSRGAPSTTRPRLHGRAYMCLAQDNKAKTHNSGKITPFGFLSHRCRTVQERAHGVGKILAIAKEATHAS